MLTDEEFFQGSLANLQRASAASKLPCLQKDFVVDEFQLLQARAHGADAVLLILAVLSPAELAALSKKAANWASMYSARPTVRTSCTARSTRAANSLA